MTWSFDVFCDLNLNKRMSKQSRSRWFETPSRSLWRHCNALSSHGIIICGYLTHKTINKPNLLTWTSHPGPLTLIHVSEPIRTTVRPCSFLCFEIHKNWSQPKKTPLDCCYHQHGYICFSDMRLVNIETEMSPLLRSFHYWLYRKLSFWRFTMQPVTKFSSKWDHFHYSYGFTKA